jgi:hypothetical protein
MCEVDQDQTGTKGVGLLFLVSPFLVTVELTNTNETIELEKNAIDENLETKKPNTFEEIVNENCTNTLVQIF